LYLRISRGLGDKVADLARKGSVLPRRRFLQILPSARVERHRHLIFTHGHSDVSCPLDAKMTDHDAPRNAPICVTVRVSLSTGAVG
jgi:hypothetical protein